MSPWGRGSDAARRWALMGTLALHGLALAGLLGGLGGARGLPAPPQRILVALLAPQRAPASLADPRPEPALAPALPVVARPLWPDFLPSEAPAVPAAAAAALRPLEAVASQAPASAPPGESARFQAAERLDCPPVQYPALLRERGIEGLARVRVQLDAQGQPRAVDLAQSSGYRLFDQAALQRAQACRYRAARVQGQAQAAVVEFPVRFLLGDA